MAVKKAKKASAAQLAWRKKFAEKVKAGAFKKSAKRKAVKRPARNPWPKSVLKQKIGLRLFKLKNEQLPAAKELVTLSQRKLDRLKKSRAEAWQVDDARRHLAMNQKSLRELRQEIAEHEKSARRNPGKTVIKAKRVTILNLKKNPPRKANITSASDLQYAGTAKKATQDGVKGWMLGSKFFPGSATTKAQKITASAYLDLRTGDVWKRKAKNPKRNVAQGFYDGNGIFHPIRASADYDGKTAGETGGKPRHTRSKKKKAASRKASQTARDRAAKRAASKTKTRLASRALQRSVPLKKKRRNVAQGFYDGNGVFHPIRASHDYDGKTAGEAGGKPRRTRSKKRAASSRKASSTARSRAATKQRKATTSRLASRSLDRSGPLKKTRRNPDTPAQLLNDFRGYPKDKDSTLYFAEGTPTGLYKLGSLYQIKLANGTKIKPVSGKVWLCADTKGKLYLGTTDSKTVLANAPQGSLGKVSQVEYQARKPHLGDNQVTRYYHNLGEETGEKPTLYSDGNGGLLFKGGATYVKSDGIHN